MTPIELSTSEIARLFGWSKGGKLKLDVEEVSCESEATIEDQMAKYQATGWTVIMAGQDKGDSSLFFLKVVRRQIKSDKAYALMAVSKERYLANSELIEALSK